jgi:hypothetical protein
LLSLLRKGSDQRLQASVPVIAKSAPQVAKLFQAGRSESFGDSQLGAISISAKPHTEASWL